MMMMMPRSSSALLPKLLVLVLIAACTTTLQQQMTTTTCLAFTATTTSSSARHRRRHHRGGVAFTTVSTQLYNNNNDNKQQQQLLERPQFVKEFLGTGEKNDDDNEDNDDTAATTTKTATTAVATTSGAKDDECEVEELSETQKLLAQIKDAGLAGVISYALWELGFWAVSVPVVIGGYYEVVGHWPDLSNTEDIEKLGAEAFAFVNFARFAVPLRIGLALSTTPWIQNNIVDRFINKKKDEDPECDPEADE